MAAAIGTTAPNTRGDTFFDVYEWGGRPGDKTGSVDNALEAIRDYILNVRDTPAMNTQNSPAVIYFRASTKHWFMLRSFFLEYGGWEIRGAGREQTIVEMVRPSRAPCFIIGMPRAPRFPTFKAYDGRTPLVLDAGHWADCFGVLDTTAAPVAGVHWGLRFRNDSNISAPLTPFSHGISDGWKSTRQMTVDFCINPGDGLKLTSSDLFGTGDTNFPSPWMFQVFGTNTILFTFATTSAGSGQRVNQSVQFSLGDCTGLTRVSFQIDLVKAKAQAFVRCDASPTYSGVAKQVAVTNNSPATFTAAADLSFAPNTYYPFQMGRRGPTVVNQSQTTTVDHTYYGLQVSAGLLYVDNSVANPLGYVGSAQVRVDGRQITDANRYFDYTNCIACLQLTDPPPGDPKCYNDGRVVTIRGGSARHGETVTVPGYFLSTNITFTPIFGMNNRISDMTVLSGQPVASGLYGMPTGSWFTAFGQAIAVGAAWEVYFDRVTATSFGQGIGALNAGASYKMYVTDSVLGGGDAAYYGFWQIVIMNRVLITQGRTGIRLASSSATINDLFIGDAAPGTEAGILIHGGQYGGQYILTNFMFDNELPYGPSQGVIVCDGSDFSTTRLEIKNLAVGRVTDGAVIVWLKDYPLGLGGDGDYRAPAARSSPRTFVLDGLQIFGSNHAAQFRTDGTLWNGTIDNVQMPYGGLRYLESVTTFDHTGPGGLGRLVCRQRDYSMPPRSGKWDAGGHVLDMQLPAPGLYATLRCVRSGTMNTATPPVWNGSDPLDSETDSLGGYLVDHTYWAPVALS